MRTNKHLKVLAAILWTAPLLFGCKNQSLPPTPSTPEVIPTPVLLWPGGAPGASGTAKNTGCAIVVAPGGAFTHRAMDYEGVTVAQWFKSRGIAAFVLRYRITPLYTRNDAVADGRRSLQYLRAHAAEYHLSPDRVGMIGFSAGSELAAMIALNPKPANRDAADPVERERNNLDYMVLAYGSSSGPVNPSNTPPTFFFCTAEDRSHATGMINLYWDMYNAHVPAEIHLFPVGEHGTGLAFGDAALGQWPELLYNWMRSRNLLTGGPTATVRGHVKLDGQPLPHGSITFIPLDNAGAPQLTAYIMNTDTAAADYQLTGEARLVPGKYRVEVRQDAVFWLSNNRDPINRRGALPADRIARIRSPGWGAPTIENVRLYRKSHPADAKDLTVEIKPGENPLDVAVFSK